MREVLNVIDNGALVHLAQSGNLDLLFANGRQTVLTQQVINEALSASDSLLDKSALIEWIDINKNYRDSYQNY